MPTKLDDATPNQKALALYSLLLFTGKRFTLTELAEKLACSKQTIMRLIRDIELQWNVLETDLDGRERWYRFKGPEKKPHLAITPQELQNLVMCRDMVSHLVPQSIKGMIDKALAATTTLLSDYSARSEAFENHWRTELKGRIDYSAFGDMLDVARAAIDEHAICRVRYAGVGKTEPREHLFAPLECVSYREALYLSGVKVRSDDITLPVGPMLLALHRISSMVLTGKHHPHAKPESGHSGFGIIQSNPVRIVVRFDRFAATYVRERVWSQDQRIDPLGDGGVRLEFTASNDSEALSWVLSFGSRAVVESPTEFRDIIRKELAKMAAGYAPQE